MFVFEIKWKPKFYFIFVTYLIVVLASGTDAASVRKMRQKRKGYMTGVVLQSTSHTPATASGSPGARVVFGMIHEQLKYCCKRRKQNEDAKGIEMSNVSSAPSVKAARSGDPPCPSMSQGSSGGKGRGSVSRQYRGGGGSSTITIMIMTRTLQAILLSVARPKIIFYFTFECLFVFNFPANVFVTYIIIICSFVFGLAAGVTGGEVLHIVCAADRSVAVLGTPASRVTRRV